MCLFTCVCVCVCVCVLKFLFYLPGGFLKGDCLEPMGRFLCLYQKFPFHLYSFLSLGLFYCSFPNFLNIYFILSCLVIAFFYIYKFIYLFIYFQLHWVFIAVCGLSLVAMSGGYSSLWCVGFSLRWLLLLRSTGSRHAGFSSYGTRAQQLWLVGSRAQAQQLWLTGLVALRHVGSSRTRARTRVPCIGRQILNHCAIREDQ